MLNGIGKIMSTNTTRGSEKFDEGYTCVNRCALPLSGPTGGTTVKSLVNENVCHAVWTHGSDFDHAEVPRWRSRDTGEHPDCFAGIHSVGTWIRSSPVSTSVSEPDTHSTDEGTFSIMDAEPNCKVGSASPDWSKIVIAAAALY